MRLGPKILTEGWAVGPEEKRKRWIEVDITETDYMMKPGEFILAATLEYVRVPVDMECVFQLKSSRGREGYNHALAAFIDPGFHGRVTLELQNINSHHLLRLKHGMLIGQLRFMQLDSKPMRSYAVTGHYQGDEGVMPSKVSIDGIASVPED